MSTRFLDELHPAFRPHVVKFLTAPFVPSLDLVLIFAWRDDAKQRELYAKGRDVLGRVVNPGQVVTWAKPGQSPHNFTLDGKPAALAIDVAPRKVLQFRDWLPNDPVWDLLGSYVGCYRDLDWGGSWPAPKTDRPHIQMRNWRQYTREGAT